jgi:hypothetical protein
MHTSALEKALPLLSQAFSLYDSLGDQKGIAGVHKNLGWMYVWKAYRDQEGMANSYLGLAYIYRQWGSLKRAEQKYRKAFILFHS